MKKLKQSRKLQRGGTGKPTLLRRSASEDPVLTHGIYSQKGGPITDSRGQWAHPGKVTRIPGNQITMRGVNYPVLGRANTGHTQMMYPNQEYYYPGASSVTEWPLMQSGGQQAPYITHDPNDPRIQAYKDSSDRYNAYYKIINDLPKGALLTRTWNINDPMLKGLQYNWRNDSNKPLSIEQYAGGYGGRRGGDRFIPTYKKPQQEVILENKINSIQSQLQVNNTPQVKETQSNAVPLPEFHPYSGSGYGNPNIPQGYYDINGKKIDTMKPMQQGGSTQGKDFPGDVPLEKKNNFLSWLKQTSLNKIQQEFTLEHQGFMDGYSSKKSKGGETPYVNGFTDGSSWLAQEGGEFDPQQWGRAIVNEPSFQYGAQVGPRSTGDPIDNFGWYDGQSNPTSGSHSKFDANAMRNDYRRMNPVANQSHPSQFIPVNYGNDSRSLNAQPDNYSNAQTTGVSQSPNSMSIGLNVPNQSSPINPNRQIQTDPSMSGSNWSTPPSFTAPQSPGNPTMDPNQTPRPGVTPSSGDYHSATITAKRKKDSIFLNPDFDIALIDTATNIINKQQRKKQESYLRKQTSADNLFSPIQGNKGDYTQNNGYFRPDQNTPVQFPGAAGFKSYKQGGEYDMDDNQIKELQRKGYKIKIL